MENNYENILRLELCNNNNNNNEIKNHSFIEYVLYVLNRKDNYKLLFNFFSKLLKYNNSQLLEEIIKYFINKDYQIVWNKLTNDEIMVLLFNIIDNVTNLDNNNENDEKERDEKLFIKLFDLLFNYFNINKSRNILFNV